MGLAPERRLVLASASPRRLALLRQIGIEPETAVHPEIDESARRGELPPQTARRLARAKAEAVDGGGAWVLGADTVVACGRRMLPKAVAEAEARRCLGLLSGRRHRVHTGVCVVDPGGRVRTRVATTMVSVKRLTVAEVSWLLSSGEWEGKAGGYAIQGRFAAFVKAINGSYSNVVGLPLFETAALLYGAGFPPVQ